MDPFSSALDLAAAVRRREVSPVEILDGFLERMDRLDPRLNAFAFRDDGTARERAARMAELVAAAPPEDLPPFAGVPLPIKNLARVAGWPTTYGSRGASEAPSEVSDPVVQRFVEAGFVLSGMTNTPELGTISFTESERHGVTRNPWNPEHTPGGSSGGAGAAVASGMAPIAHASDGGGSIRIPASCNGLVGLKPTRNRVPNGANQLEGFVSEGVVTRTVADTAAVLDVLGRPDPCCWYNAPPPAQPFAVQASRPPDRLRIAVSTTPLVDLPVDAACVAAVEEAARALAELGHDVVDDPLELPDAGALVGSFTTIWNTGSADTPLEDWGAIEPLNAALRAEAAKVDSLAYRRAVATTERLCRPLIAQFGERFDVVVTPTMAVEPPRCGSHLVGAEEAPINALLNCYPMAVFTSIWNVTGQPALSLPLHTAPSGLPVGVQLVAGPWQEGRLLALGAQLEQARPWAARRPAIS